MSKELLSKIEWTCKMKKVKPEIINGTLRIVEHTNLAYVEPHRVIIKDKLYLFFNEQDYFYKGYYVHKLPIPTDKPRRYKNIEPDWLYNVLNFIKIASYLEIYKFCGLKIDWKNLVYNI